MEKKRKVFGGSGPVPPKRWLLEKSRRWKRSEKKPNCPSYTGSKNRKSKMRPVKPLKDIYMARENKNEVEEEQDKGQQPDKDLEIDPESIQNYLASFTKNQLVAALLHKDEQARQTSLMTADGGFGFNPGYIAAHPWEVSDAPRADYGYTLPPPPRQAAPVTADFIVAHPGMCFCAPRYGYGAAPPPSVYGDPCYGYGALPPPFAYNSPSYGYSTPPPPRAYGVAPPPCMPPPPVAYGGPLPPGAYGAPSPLGAHDVPLSTTAYGLPPPGEYGVMPPPGAYGVPEVPGEYGAPPPPISYGVLLPPGEYGAALLPPGAAATW